MSVTYAQGFRAAGVASGIKNSGKRDVALVVNDGPNHIAGVVTTQNRVFAAPVAWTRQAFDGTFHAVVLNSGGANAATGEAGFSQSQRTAEYVGASLGLGAEDVAVCSTGLIGELLPMEKMLSGVDSAVAALSDAGGADAAEAILTTDTHSKTATYSSSHGYRMGGMVKGAGMLAPAMATMLCVITTDAVLDSALAQRALERAINYSFNRIDSDGAMSTNDTVILMASGASGVAPDADAFTDELTNLAQDLARQLIADAEGASHEVKITVRGAVSEDQALIIARAISRSNLLKAAIFGNDPNWGRVISQVGTVPESMAQFDAQNIDVWFNGVQVCRASGLGDDRSNVDLASNRLVEIVVNVNAGKEEAELWTNDLTYDYVHENSAYSS
ncbi:MAG: bifunctional glutamate N-acetyltransferase/amino-acid acetyltransferase ArgJ [Actinomycetaceae bacterium]|nr:bifunctional glutamate N-acetyltransferase/amino-acid acetyltransferase ArgJ [Arcanobacterium sp.]MDD7505321.1 bifunctional glutamate N-acetyltransferase/amino-acid acetyltransferase ArgJ [Actinomycetaceae bacterium]MDY6142958.1 bifunctional glutamate N-acetyltransferase/amino-acid acetyltransferase ArgJ [Arcanobacterium sp.]